MPDESLPDFVRILLTAVAYAIAIVALVLLAPSGDHVFIYRGF